MSKTLEEVNVQILKNRIKNVNDAFQALDQAKKNLTALEKFTVQRANDELIDIAELALTTSDLRDCISRILIELIESQVVPEKKSGWHHD